METENTDEVPTRHQHSTNDDDDEGEDNLEDQQNTAAASGTEEERMTSMAESSAETEAVVDAGTVDASMPSELESSPAVSPNRANRLSSDSSSLFGIEPDFSDPEFFVPTYRTEPSSLVDDDDDDDDENDWFKISTVADVMNKPKPQYTWCATQELMRREHGLSGDARRSLGSGMSHGFNARFYAARHIVERMKISHCLMKHTGSVNSLHFNPAGDLLCSGSDDKSIIIWNWAQKQPKYVFESGHTENIFQTKFVNSVGALDIVSAGGDGQVRRSILPSSGGKPQTSLLYRHYSAVHKLVMSPSNPFEIISAGEDGDIKLKDLRTGERATTICTVETRKKKRVISLFSISHHPSAPQVCVSGYNRFVRIYDKRSMKEPVLKMCPKHFLNNMSVKPQVTCAVYNSTGSEVLASYLPEHIYLFNINEYQHGKYLHRYRVPIEHDTKNGVNFFGPHSEYVVSCSKLGDIIFWDKNTGAIINFMPGDSMGVVKCLEPNPAIPVLATSYRDSSIKIWTPSGEKYPPDLSKLEACLERNLRRFEF